MMETVESCEHRPSIEWKGSEIPTLYGIRGLAALNVVLSHLGVKGANAIYGVIWFFVLSGFLITHLLLREQQKRGTVSLRRFYLRRALRIFPAFYGYTIFYIVGRLILQLPIDWPSVVACITYTSNYYFAFGGHALATMVHVWSLAVEEQFYLAWPFIFLVFSRDKPKLIRILLVAIPSIWLYRWLANDFGFNGVYIYGAFETRADALAIGCLIAVANREGLIPRWLIKKQWLSGLVLTLTLISSVTELNGPRYAWTLVALGFAVVLIQATANAGSLWFRWLDSQPMRALGVISYSLYLYHPFANRLPSYLHVLPVEVVFSIAIATASYWIVEKPFLGLKGRVSKTEFAVPTGSHVETIRGS